MDFNVDIKDLENRIKSACIDTLEDAATIAVGEAQFRCPVDTGALRLSITHDNVDKNKLSVNVGSSIYYAKYVEEGHNQGSGHVDGRWMIHDGITVADVQMEGILQQKLGSRFSK